jgi:hypothetical protein
MRLWFIYYAMFGRKYTLLALGSMVLVMGFFFYCLVHGTFDSGRPAHIVPVTYRSRPVDFRLPPSDPHVETKRKSH